MIVFVALFVLVLFYNLFLYNFLFSNNLVVTKVVFENLQNEFKNMCNELNIEENELPHINKSAGNVSEFKKELSKENIDLINERYYTDFFILDYKFL